MIKNIHKISFFVTLLFVTGYIKAQENSLSVTNDDSSEWVVLDFLHKQNIPITYNNKLKVLNSGEEKFNNLFTDIEKAEHHIHLEYFNFRDDSIGNTLFGLLFNKAQQGVEIRIICDDFGNWSNNQPFEKKFVDRVRSKGIDFIFFDPISFPYLNHIYHRDHRKIVVIDGKIAYTGGMNVADYYITGRPKIGNWYDTHLRIEGDAARNMQKIFLNIWNEITKQNIGGDHYYYEHTEKTGKIVAIAEHDDKTEPKQILQTYNKSISAAKNKIQIVNPYFLPPLEIKDRLRLALKRGVKVEIMFSKVSDIKFTPDGSIKIAYELMEEGADIYLYEDGFLHSKIMMIDDTFCTIGSTNLDSRSLYFDCEINAFIFDKEITGELIKNFEKNKSNSMLLTPETKKKVTVWKKFVGWCADILTPFL